MAILRKIGILFLVFAFVFTMVSVQSYIEPQSIHAFALSWVVIGALYALVAAAGLYSYNYEDINKIVMDLWSKSSDYMKAKIDSLIDSTAKTIDVDQELADHVNQYVENNYDPYQMQQALESYFVSAEFSPGVQYQYISYTGEFSGSMQEISADLYNDPRAYDSILFGDTYKALGYVNVSSWWYLHVDDVVCSSGQTDNGAVFTSLGYYSAVMGEDIYIQYNSRRISDSEFRPKFAFLYNPDSEIMRAVIMYYDGYSGYYAKYFMADISGSVFSGVAEVQGVTDYVDAVVDATASLEAGVLDIDVTLNKILELLETQGASTSTLEAFFEQYGYLPVSISSDLNIPEGYLDWSSLTLNVELLAGKFPFSIPFDLANAMSTMVRDPEVPIIEVPLQDTPLVGGSLMTLDFSPFQPLANIIRWGVLIIFNIGLIMVTRKLIRG